MGRLDLQRVSAQLHGRRLRGPLLYREQTTSTNDDALALAAAGATEGTVVIAGEQVQGRGRRQRSWAGHLDHSLLFTLILRPTLPPELFPRLVNMIGVGVADGCGHAAGCPVGTKWPNDVMAGGRKIVGILVEARAPGYAVAGIGINVLGGATDFPPELRDKAGTLASCATTSLTREDVLAAVLNETDRWYDALLRGEWDQVLARQRELETTLGHEHTVLVGDEHISGIVRDLSPEGGLVIETADGLRTVTVGEVS